MIDHVRFAWRMLRARLSGQPTSCPYCASENTRKVGTKQVVLELRECQVCWLRYRYPKDDVIQNFDYYQEEYSQGRVTDLPPGADLPKHMANNFREVGRDISVHLGVMQQFVTKGRLLDFGASWGYCTWQFQRAGFDAVGFEISRPRTAYGQKMLGVEMVNGTAALPDHSIDVIYTAHVLEHVADPATTLKEFRRLLAPGGHLFVFVPNGGGADARRMGVEWPTLINQKHVMAYTPRFFAYSLGDQGLKPLIASWPYDSPPRPFELNGGEFDGEELLGIGVAAA